MKILCIGDIFGNPGIKIAEKFLPSLIRDYKVDFVIANGENLCGGRGANRKTIDCLGAAGVDAFTMGNHTWDNSDLQTFINDDRRIARPANYPGGVPGKGWRSFISGGNKIAVCNIIGRVFMAPAECPFNAMNEVLREIKAAGIKCVVVDFHAEATAEKMAMGWYLDGRVSVVFGTHTHVQTADLRLLNHGTAYITDIGMTGPKDSVLGVDKNIIIKKMLTQMPQRFKPAQGDIQFNGVLFDIGENGAARGFETINFYDSAL
jgi:metallophosphoesterase (TIGR00282 family)